MAYSIISLPKVCIAVTATADAVWCADGERLVAFEEGGKPRFDRPLNGVRSLGSSKRLLAAIVDSGILIWLDPHLGREIGSLKIDGTAELVSGGGEVWMISRQQEVGWHVGEPGQLLSPVNMPGIDRAAADGDRIWWTSCIDSKLRDGSREIDLGVGQTERKSLVVCANSVWLSVLYGFVRVGTWDASKGPVVATGLGLLPLLACGGGTLVGGSALDGIYIFDPSADAGIRKLETGPVDDMAMLAATRTTVWIFSGLSSEIRLISFRR